MRFLLLFSFLFGALRAEILTLNTFEELPTFVEEKTLVLLDIDDTLIDSCLTLGSGVQWHDFMNRFKKECSNERVWRLTSRTLLWAELPLRSPEPCVPQVIAVLQSKGVKVLGFTARAKQRNAFRYFDLITKDNLKEVGIELEEIIYAGRSKFLTPARKGDALLAFLHEQELRPHLVILVDDQLHNLKGVEEALQLEGIPFKGLHYRKGEENHQGFDPLVGAIQMRAFLTGAALPTDAEALIIKERHPEWDFEDYMRPFFDWIKEDERV